MNHVWWGSLRSAAAALALAASGAAAAIDLGEPSVLSQQGQRLKLAIPFGSEPGERVPVLRFSVVAVEAPAGHAAPSAEGFVLAMPERRRIIYVQSREPVTAPALTLTLQVAGSGTPVVLEIEVPPASAGAAGPLQAR